MGLGFHAFNVFVKNGFLGSQWEERKIQQYMNEDIRR
ncbi:2TM domain-containing protein [Kordia algicida OT-1]|nr:2TM domain-containing protein [Kordia algicida]